MNVLANTDAGRSYLSSRGVSAELLSAISSFGLSSWCNVLAAIKLAKRLHLGEDDVVLTVATDGAAMYQSELTEAVKRDWPDGFNEVSAAQVSGEYLLGAGEDHLLECTDTDRNRIFNLGYYTWVEQQGISIEEFEARRRPELLALPARHRAGLGRAHRRAERAIGSQRLLKAHRPSSLSTSSVCSPRRGGRRR